MRMSIVPIMLALVHCATSISAIPFIASSSVIAPRTIAGTRFATKSLEPRRGTSTVRWNAPNSQTYVLLTMRGALPGNLVLAMLNVARSFVQQALLQRGDVVIAGGGVDYNGQAQLTFQTWNTNNHQQTYGVLMAAIAALRDYMEGHGFGAATFVIFDGANEVGNGFIGPAQ